MTRALFFSLLLLGCGATHGLETDAGADEVDAGPALEDSGTMDFRDTGPADAGPARLTSCTLRVGDAVGEGCFCPGRIAAYGDVVYRQSIGIEIWDVTTPLSPRDAGTLVERAVSSGALGIVDGHLVSVGNFDAGLRVYSLADPLAPVLRSEVSIEPSIPEGLAVTNDFAVVQNQRDASVTGVDLRNIDVPVVAYNHTIEGRIAALLIVGERLFVSTSDSTITRSWLEDRDLRTGELTGRHVMDEGEESGTFFVGLAAHDGRVVRTTRAGLQVLDVDGPEPVVVGQIDLGREHPNAVTVHGDLALVGGVGLVVVDLSDPTSPRELGRSDISVGDVRVVSRRGDAIFVSSGNGMQAIALDCE